MGKLEGKIALVTGVNSGIGLAMAKRFVSEGTHVFITGLRDRELTCAFHASALPEIVGRLGRSAAADHAVVADERWHFKALP